VLPEPNGQITVLRKVLCPCLRSSEIKSDPNTSRSNGSGPPQTIENTRIALKELPLAENAARCGKVCKELSHLPAIEITSRHAPFAVLRPLAIPQQPWQDILMDFVMGLPRSKDHDAIWVVVDRLTKQRHLVPCSTTVDTSDLASLFLQHVFRLHGLPRTITSDRGPEIASAFWHRLCARLEIEPRLSTAFHPQTDGQTEQMNAVMEQYLQSYVNYLQDDWADWLPIAEFASHNHTLETTAVSPFFANLSYDPRWQFSCRPPYPTKQKINKRVLRRKHCSKLTTT